ncbi:MAG TPA: ATPase, T2SS/T4P/T4SS family [Ilumatobacter sp.]|nr:ATPase, T2SS/T4P/T4SS family [Ilumatobacter sp.]
MNGATELQQLDHLVDAVCLAASNVHGNVHTVAAEQTRLLFPLITAAEHAAVVSQAVSRLAGLDVLDQLLADPLVDEVMVNRGRDVWVDRAGSVVFAGELPAGAIDAVLERALAPIGKRLDRASPVVDARLPDGSRLCAVVAPIAVDGTTVSIRRHRVRRLALESFCGPEVTQLLDAVVARRANVLVTGATSSGKTSLLRALADRAGFADRFVVLEDTSELTFPDRHVVRLEARPPAADSVRAVPLGELVRTALRLRPDRLVIGEFRGDEVVSVIQALNTGHDGSLSTCHANTALDGLHRVETLVLQAAPNWPLAAIRQQISRSIDVIVHVERAADGARRVAEVVEPVVTAGEPSTRQLATADRVVAEFERARR